VDKIESILSFSSGSRKLPTLRPESSRIAPPSLPEMPAALGFDGEEDEEFSAIVTPIEIAGERLGTLFLYRRGQSYTIDDIILCEYGSTVVGLEMLWAGTGFDDSRALKFAQRVDNNGTGNTRLIRNFTCDQNAFRPLILFRTGSDQPDFSGAAWDGRHSGRK